VKCHGEGVAEISGGGAGCERYDLKNVFRFDWYVDSSAVMNFRQ
jgi:hypothetical protein